MQTNKLRAIVLKEIATGESNKQLIVLAKGEGKMLLFARGARNIKSKLLAPTQLFCYTDFIVTQKNGFYFITQAQLIESFYPIRMDIYKLAFGTYFLELLERTVLEGIVEDKAFYLLLKALSHLATTSLNPILICCIFELKYLQIIGYHPELELCSKCGNSYREAVYFQPWKDSFLCENCKNKDTEEVFRGTWKAIKYIYCTPIEKLFSFRVSNEVLMQLWQITRNFMECNLDMKLHTLEYAIHLMGT